MKTEPQDGQAQRSSLVCTGWYEDKTGDDQVQATWAFVDSVLFFSGNLGSEVRNAEVTQPATT